MTKTTDAGAVKVLAYFGLAMAILLWSISYISIHNALKYVSVSELNVIRFIVVNAILWTVQLIRPKRMAIRRKDYLLVFIAGILGTAGYYYFENLSLMYTTPGIAGVVNGAIPITTLIVAMLFFGKKTRFRNILLVFLSFAGIAVLAMPTDIQNGSTLTGIMVVMLANVFWAFYVLLNDRLDHSYDRLQVLTLHYTSGMVAFISFYIMDLAMHPRRQLPDMEALIQVPEAIGNILFLAVLSSIVSYLLYNIAIVHIGVMMSAMSINVIPVLTLLISVGAGLEALSFNKVIGCLMVVIAIFFMDDL